MTDTQIIILVYAVLIAVWIFLYRYTRRRFKHEIEAVEDRHKAEDTTLDVNNIDWEELGFELGERPFIKLK